MSEPSAAQVRPGDIVRYDGHAWDVRGWDTMRPREPDGHQPVILHLERVERPTGTRKKTITERADERTVELLARQEMLPDLADPRPEDRVRHSQ